MVRVRARIVRVVAVAATAGGVVAGCTSHHAAGAGAPEVSPGPISPTPITVTVASRAYGDGTAPAKVPAGKAVRLGSNRLAFRWSGSHSCPPVVSSANVSGRTLVIPLDPPRSMCTLDEKLYVVVVSLSAPEFPPGALQSVSSITVRAIGGQTRLPLVPA